MATKRRKGQRWEYVIKRAGLLEKPIYLTFATEAEGDAFVANVEKLLDRGIIPHEFQPQETMHTLGAVIRQYLRDAHPKQKDREVLNTVLDAKGDTRMLSVDANWVDGWITAMKREDGLAPATIRAKIGATARACDWAIRKKLITLADHPFRTLPKGYASYTATDAALAGQKKVDVSRDRRLEADEEKRIREVIQSGELVRKQRNRKIDDPESFMVDFDLAIETAMRLRERYTLEVAQVNLERRTIYLDKTKNGDARQVPLSSVAVNVLRVQLRRRDGEARVFPWWNGDESEAVLKKTSNYLSKFYADIFEAAGCPDLREHDLRHEAVSRLFERTTLPAEAIMKISGHKSHRMVMRYLSLRGTDLASQLW